MKSAPMTRKQLDAEWTRMRYAEQATERKQFLEVFAPRITKLIGTTHVYKNFWPMDGGTKEWDVFCKVLEIVVYGVRMAADLICEEVQLNGFNEPSIQCRATTLYGSSSTNLDNWKKCSAHEYDRQKGRVLREIQSPETLRKRLVKEGA